MPQPAVTTDILTHSAIADELWRDLPLSLLAEAQRLGTSALHCILVHRACVDAVLCAVNVRISNISRNHIQNPRSLGRWPLNDRQLSSPTPLKLPLCCRVCLYWPTSLSRNPRQTGDHCAAEAQKFEKGPLRG